MERWATGGSARGPYARRQAPVSGGRVWCGGGGQGVAECSRSKRSSFCVRPGSSPRATQSNDMAPAGQRMHHHLDVSVRALAACSSLAARSVGRFARPIPSQSALYANVPLVVTMQLRPTAPPASTSEPESVSAGHHLASSNEGGTHLWSNSHVPSSPKHRGEGGRHEVPASPEAV